MDNQIQTIVVHRDQLTPENMGQLAESGYTIMNDPSLLIFGRNVPAVTGNRVKEDYPIEESGIEENAVVVSPTPIGTTRNNKRQST